MKPIPITPDMTPLERTSTTHLNALVAEIEWFLQQGVGVTVRTQGTKYNVELRNESTKRRRRAKPETRNQKPETL